jgi:mRNA interferase MazF
MLLYVLFPLSRSILLTERLRQRVTNDEFVILPSDLEFAQTGLKSPSKVRVARIVTLERSLLQRRLGQLSSQHLQQLDLCLVNAFQINS